MRSTRHHGLVHHFTDAARSGLTHLGVRAQLALRDGFASAGAGRSAREPRKAAGPRDAGYTSAPTIAMFAVALMGLALAVVIVAKVLDAVNGDPIPAGP